MLTRFIVIMKFVDLILNFEELHYNLYRLLSTGNII